MQFSNSNNSEAYTQSMGLLYKASTTDGFVASVQAITNYRRIWTRDGVINGLAALLSGDSALIETFAQTLHTLFTHQHPTGFFPSNVDPQTHKASYGGNCGRVDNVSWAVIGLMEYTMSTHQSEVAEAYQTHVEKAMALMNAWEFNGKHLVYVPQSGNWADEYVQHGYVLYDQLLRIWALELAGKYYNKNQWLEKAIQIRKVLEANYWNETSEQSTLYAPNLIHQLKNAPTDYWLMGFNPARVYLQFDLAANSLALLLNLGNSHQQAVLMDYLQNQIETQGFLLASFSPAIQEGDWLMGDLKDNYAYEFRNLPHEFHNGGLWPVWNGWLSAALASQGESGLAGQVMGYMEQANRSNLGNTEWDFYENFHGISHAPIGVPYCTWSAGGYVIAHAYSQGKRLF